MMTSNIGGLRFAWYEKKGDGLASTDDSVAT